MKNLLLVLLFVGGTAAFAQTKTITKPVYQPLPMHSFKTLRDSCTQLDIVFTSGAGSSMSVEGKNVSMFSTFVEPSSIATKSEAPKDGFIMWQRNGHEFITGDLYLISDSTAYISFKIKEAEYFNLLSTQGATFLRRQKK